MKKSANPISRFEVFLLAFVFSVASMNTFGETIQPRSKTIRDLIGVCQTNALRNDDGGTLAREACVTAFDLRDVKTLQNALMNPNYGVRKEAVALAGEWPKNLATQLVISALTNDDIWKEEKKIGEQIAAQQSFERAFLDLTSKLLNSKIEIDLHDAGSRSSLLQKLRSIN